MNINKKDYKFCEKVYEFSSNSYKKVYCNYLEYIIIMRIFGGPFIFKDYCNLLKNKNIISDFCIIKNNVFIEDRICKENKKECCCLCTGTLYKNNDFEKCKIKQEHGYCEEFQKVCV